MSEIAVSMRHISKSFGKKVIANKNVDLDIYHGEILSLLGENGSGKTTLMKALLGLIPCASGHIVMGEGLKPTEIGYLPQQSAIQKDFPASVEEVVLSGTVGYRGLKPFYGRTERESARKHAAEESPKRNAQERSHGLAGPTGS